MDKNMKVGVLVIGVILILLGANYLLTENKIKQANIDGYTFLEKISKCDTVYNIDISSGKGTTEFKKDCLEDATKSLGGISFKPGEKGDKFILESEEYLGCMNINDLKGSEAYKKCVKDILPTLREKYPEVN